MADQYIQVQPNSTGLKVDVSELQVSGQTVERQRMVIADPSSAVQLAGVTPAGALKVDGSGVTQPISGSVAVSLLPALSAGANTIGAVKLTDGTNQASVRNTAGANALNVAIVDAGGNQITSFGGTGGGSITQYAEGATVTTGTGDLLLAKNGATINALQTDAAKNLNVNLAASSATVPVSGAFWPATQPVSGSVSVSNLPATQPVSGAVAVSSLPALPAGSNALGTVGVTSLPALPAGSNAIGTVTANAGTGTFSTTDGNAIPQGTANGSQKGFLELGVVSAAAPSYTSGNLSPLSLNPTGGLRVDGSAVTQPVSGAVSVSNFPATQPVSGTVAVSALPALPAGANAIGSVSVSNFPATQPVSIAATVNTSSLPTTTGGLSTTKLISAASTNPTSIKTSAGQVYNIQAFNTNASSVRYLKLYNKASAPTVGADIPVNTWLIPANGSGVVIEMSNGLACATGIAFAITGGLADTDATAINASEVIVNLQYK